MNKKTLLLASLPSKDAISMLKEECTPKGEIERDKNERCGVKATKDVKDDWGDSCEGSECELRKGHAGNHMATDGANGWVYYSDDEIRPKKEMKAAVATSTTKKPGFFRMLIDSIKGI